MVIRNDTAEEDSTAWENGVTQEIDITESLAVAVVDGSDTVVDISQLSGLGSQPYLRSASAACTATNTFAGHRT